MLFSTALLLIGIGAGICGDPYVASPTIVLSVLGFAGVWYSNRRPALTLSAPPETRTLLFMSLVWLGVGLGTLIVGVIGGGLILAVACVGFALSMYLFVGLLVAAIRR